jgi:hypothetical protein
VLNELTRLLDYNAISSKLSSLSSINGCTLVAGADQGAGAWHYWIKTVTMSGTDIREKRAVDEKFDLKDSYITSQAAHITCKKDHPKILQETVSTSYQWHIRHSDHHH